MKELAAPLAHSYVYRYWCYAFLKIASRSLVKRALSKNLVRMSDWLHSVLMCSKRNSFVLSLSRMKCRDAWKHRQEVLRGPLTHTGLPRPRWSAKVEGRAPPPPELQRRRSPSTRWKGVGIACCQCTSPWARTVSRREHCHPHTGATVQWISQNRRRQPRPEACHPRMAPGRTRRTRHE